MCRYLSQLDVKISQCLFVFTRDSRTRESLFTFCCTESFSVYTKIGVAAVQNGYINIGPLMCECKYLRWTVLVGWSAMQTQQSQSEQFLFADRLLLQLKRVRVHSIGRDYRTTKSQNDSSIFQVLTQFRVHVWLHFPLNSRILDICSLIFGFFSFT